MKISFAAAVVPTSGCVALTVLKDRKLGIWGAKLDKKTGGALKRAMESALFEGKANEVLTVLAPARTRLTKIVLVGLGDSGDVNDLVLQKAGGTAMAAIQSGKDVSAIFIADEHKGVACEGGRVAAQVAFGAKLRSYRFDKYLTKDKARKPVLKGLVVATTDMNAAKRAYTALDSLAEGVFLTRDLVSEPANIVYPESFAEACKPLKNLGLKVEILDEKHMAKLGMNALLGVAQGSVRPPRLVALSWMGDPKATDKRPLAFVGKGVTFDSGGISIKPAAGMEEMKWDMAGAGAVVGVMRALAANKVKANVVGIVGLVENMPSGSAQRPGDIVTSMSGQTIEIHNTDAEGRLVLADALWYCQETCNPRAIVDLATLTGAIIVSLGHEYAGLFSNDDDLVARLTGAGKAVDELLWRFPLSSAYDKDIDSDAADMKNIGGGRGAGSITAAQFLQRFIKKDVVWAHLDIAGTAWQKRDAATVPKGATGFGVKILYQFVEDYIRAK